MEVALISIVVLAFIIAWGLFLITLPKHEIDTRSMDVNPMAFGEMDYKDPVPDSQKPILMIREYYNEIRK